MRSRRMGSPSHRTPRTPLKTSSWPAVITSTTLAAGELAETAGILARNRKHPNAALERINRSSRTFSGCRFHRLNGYPRATEYRFVFGSPRVDSLTAGELKRREAMPVWNALNSLFVGALIVGWGRCPFHRKMRHWRTRRRPQRLPWKAHRATICRQKTFST